MFVLTFEYYLPMTFLVCGQVFHQDVLASLLAPESSQYAVRTALEIFMAYCNQSAFPVLQDMFEDPLGLSEGLTSECSFLSCVPLQF